MGKTKTSSLAEDVLSRVVTRRPGHGTWFSRLPADVQEEFAAVRATFDPSRHQLRAFALALIEAARERGYETSGIQGVITWLKADRR